jgi:predicted lipoprotein with Yx(FWY)xxD motif
MRRRVRRWTLPVVLAAALGAGVATAATAAMPHTPRATVKTVKSGNYGTVLVSSTGRALYRYTLDRKNVSRCTGACAKLWPPLLVKAKVKPTIDAGGIARLLETIKSAHGMRQVTYAGFPLYRFSGDTRAGQTKGEGLYSKWYLVNSKGALVKHPVKKASGPSGSAWG